MFVLRSLSFRLDGYCNLQTIADMEAGVEPASFQISHATKDFLSGGAAGMFGVIVGSPLDVVRVRQQQRSESLSAFAQLRKLVSEGGRSLFRGVSYPLGTAALTNALAFQGYGIASRFLNPDPQQPLSLIGVFWAGGWAGGWWLSRGNRALLLLLVRLLPMVQLPAPPPRSLSSSLWAR